MTDYKLVPVEPTPEMVAAGARHLQIMSLPEREAAAIFRAMLAAAPDVQGELVAWLSLCIKGDRKGQVEIAEPHWKTQNPEYWTDAFAVYKTLKHAEQQPAPDVDVLVEAPINVSYTDGNGASRSSPADCRYGVRYVTIADTVYWPLSADDAQLLRSAECGKGEFSGQTQPSPDVSALVEALKWLRGAINCTPENDKYQRGTWISTGHPRIKRIDALIAAYHKGGEA